MACQETRRFAYARVKDFHLLRLVILRNVFSNLMPKILMLRDDSLSMGSSEIIAPTGWGIQGSSLASSAGVLKKVKKSLRLQP